MLLFVLQSDFETSPDLAPLPCGSGLHLFKCLFADPSAVTVNRDHGRPRKQPSQRPRVHLSHLLVIGVEQVTIAGMNRSLRRREGFQHKGLEEPAGVGKVPLRRTDGRHGLDDVVLCFQRLAQRLCATTHTQVALQLRGQYSHSILCRHRPPLLWLPLYCYGMTVCPPA